MRSETISITAKFSRDLSLETSDRNMLLVESITECVNKQSKTICSACYVADKIPFQAGCGFLSGAELLKSIHYHARLVDCLHVTIDLNPLSFNLNNCRTVVIGNFCRKTLTIIFPSLVVRQLDRKLFSR